MTYPTEFLRRHKLVDSPAISDCLGTLIPPPPPQLGRYFYGSATTHNSKPQSDWPRDFCRNIVLFAFLPTPVLNLIRTTIKHTLHELEIECAEITS